jgi:hypothetical protein
MKETIIIEQFDNGVTITITAGGAASAVGSNWNKTDVETNGLRVIADEVLATNLVDGNLTPITDASTSLILTITGLTPGQHSLKAYHNNSDKNQVQPDIDISVDGTVVATGQKFTSAAQSTLEAGTSFITFNVTEGQPVVITYTTKLEASVAYTNTRMMLNGLEFDAVAMVATDPQPENHDFHAATAISQQPIANSPRNATLSKRELPIVRREFFTLDGRQVTTMQSHETYIMRTTDAEGHRQSVKIIKN